MIFNIIDNLYKHNDYNTKKIKKICRPKWRSKSIILAKEGDVAPVALLGAYSRKLNQVYYTFDKRIVFYYILLFVNILFS